MAAAFKSGKQIGIKKAWVAKCSKLLAGLADDAELSFDEFKDLIR